MYQYLFSFLFLILFLACSSPEKNNQYTDKEVVIVNKYAKGFEVFKGGNYTKIEVVYQNQKKTYLLLNHSQEIPKNISYDFLIKTPIQSIVTLSSVQIAFLEKLNQLSSVVGIDNINYCQNDFLQKKHKEGKITEVGDITQINHELLLSLQANVVMTYPTQGGQEELLISQGIPLIINAEYMEETPLARAEWIKFMAYFYEKEEEATQIFDEIENAYLIVKKQLKPTTETIFSGKIYQDTWYISGGKSYPAQLLKDAGFSYLWEKDSITGTLPLSEETAFLQAKNADYWFLQIHEANNYTYQQLGNEHPLYKELACVKNKKVICVNTAKVDYYGKAVLEPHILLQDLVTIFKKDTTQTMYYKLLK